jgi:hypothetical protein
MSEWRLETPVSLFIFNRPETTARVFTEIRRVQPPKLLVVADGPRPNHPEDIQNCARARAILEEVDWPCELLFNYSDQNMGCKQRVSKGLDWIFQNVDQAIILEDDCLPHPTFFRFCDELLEYYRTNERIMHISGDNFQFGRKRGEGSYYFSIYPHVWGWATWASRWKKYDVDMKAWSSRKHKDQYLADFMDQREREFWRDTWDSCQSGKISTWDYQWGFACIANGGLAILPQINLVSNIGFGKNASHTQRQSVVGNVPVGEMQFPLMHPDTIRRDEVADAFTRCLFFTRRTRGWWWFNRLKQMAQELV